MKYLWMLAAAASLAACHNRSEDEVGAAPDQGRTDTTAVAADTSKSTPTDSTMGQRPGATDTSFVQQDSTSAGAGVDSTNAPSSSGNAPSDTTTSQQTSDSSTSMSQDTTGMSHDSTGMGNPTDSTSQPKQ
jgi:type IV pilus biogenesis protein CpaD/CtpE